MKIQIALLALSLTASSFAFGASAKPTVKECAFGESSADLSEMLDSKARGKIWYRGEHLSVHSKQRLQGLTHREKEMILIAQGSTASAKDSDEERLESFASAEGYIAYFQHNSNGRNFVMVGSFPGDNEFGVVLELLDLRRGRDVKILRTVAVIEDGDLADCTVEKE